MLNGRCFALDCFGIGVFCKLPSQSGVYVDVIVCIE